MLFRDGSCRCPFGWFLVEVDDEYITLNQIKTMLG